MGTGARIMIELVDGRRVRPRKGHFSLEEPFRYHAYSTNINHYLDSKSSDLTTMEHCRVTSSHPRASKRLASRPCRHSWLSWPEKRPQHIPQSTARRARGTNGKIPACRPKERVYCRYNVSDQATRTCFFASRNPCRQIGRQVIEHTASCG